jgi:hypothetical protein
MFQMPPIAIAIYLLAFMGAVWVLIYSYSQWRKNNNKELMRGVLGCLLILNLIWSLIVRQFIISGAPNASLLDMSRKILTVISIVAGIVLYINRNRITSFR